MTNEEQLIEWKKYGLTLHIPCNSLPEHLSHFQLKVAVAFSGNFKFPGDGILASAVYSFSHDLGDRELCCPFTLGIQHCAANSALSKLYLLRANAHSNKFDEVNSSYFTLIEGCCKIKVYTFSSFTLWLRTRIQSFLSRRQLNYCAEIYCTNIQCHQFDIKVFIIKDLKALGEVCHML